MPVQWWPCALVADGGGGGGAAAEMVAEVEIEDLDETVVDALLADVVVVVVAKKSGQLQHSPEPLPDHAFGLGASY